MLFVRSLLFVAALMLAAAAAQAQSIQTDAGVVVVNDSTASNVTLVPLDDAIGQFIAKLPRAVKKFFPVPDTIMVMVQIAIGQDGMIQEANIIKSIPFLDSRSLEAAWQWEFQPDPDRLGVIHMTIPFKFALVPLREK